MLILQAVNNLAKGVYDPKAFFLHAASLRQTFVHCAIFLVAATRRCTARVSVQLWLIDLSVQLPVIALVGFYPANKLIGRRLLSWRTVKSFTQSFTLKNSKSETLNSKQNPIFKNIKSKNF